MSHSSVITGSFLRRQTRRRTPGCRAQRGVALIEALISILIFAFGVLGLMGLEARAINFSVDAEDRNRAALFASEVASTLWLSGSIAAGASAANITAWNTAINVVNAPQTGLVGGAITVIPVAGTTNAADIKITWTPQAHAADVTETTSQLTTRVILP
jgi:type IV pilus assembly protein PilV